MNDIKSIVAKNISELRQAKGLTQLELAEKLNYSDKAISKWEHGDSLPDITVLVEIADLFGVELDYLVRAEHTKEEIKKESRKPKYSFGVITAVAILLVWFIAMFIFVLISLITTTFTYQWMAFIYAVPVSMLLWLILNSIWFNKRRNYLIISFLMWTSFAALHISLIPLGYDIWLIYLLGAPAQVIIGLWSVIKKRR